MRVLVQPRAKHPGFAGPVGDHMKIRVVEPPADGQANAAVRRFLAEVFGVPQGRVELLSGTSSRRKRWRIVDPERIPREIRNHMA
jgi:uncharacterized protein (TIGR00251 family)